MANSTGLRFALSVAISLALLQSCGVSPPSQRPEPPPPTDITDVETEPFEHVDWTALAKLPTPAKESDAPPVKLPTKPSPPELPPESVVSSPAVDAVMTGLKYDTVVSQRPAPVPGSNGWQYRKNPRGQIVGFEFSNRGGNRILPERYDIGKNKHFTRDFQFRFDDRARQDIHFSITDWVPSRDKQFRLSELMNSVLLFFPRIFVPAIATVGANSVVTLPTGEKVDFDAKSHEIVSGVFAEAPVALGAPRFPSVAYTGKGVTVRADARGNDPRIKTVATITTGSPDPNCAEGERCNRCQVPARELWEQKGAVRFRFPTDEEFDRYLRARCGFGLPQAPATLVNHASRD
jgi:hypothetical protein